jgi:hypothetical protein
MAARHHADAVGHREPEGDPDARRVVELEGAERQRAQREAEGGGARAIDGFPADQVVVAEAACKPLVAEQADDAADRIDQHRTGDRDIAGIVSGRGQRGGTGERGDIGGHDLRQRRVEQIDELATDDRVWMRIIKK